MSTHLETVHKVELNAADYDYVNKSSNSTSVYWFVDCIFKQNTTDYTFYSNYTEPNIQHEILGIVVANIPTSTSMSTSIPAVSTTTVSPNTTTSSNTTAVTISMSTTTEAPSKTDVNFPHHIINSTFTSDCQQKKHVELLLSAVQLKNNQKYGYFSRSVLTKGKVFNVDLNFKQFIFVLKF